MTGDQLAVPTCWLRRRQTGSHLAIQLDTAAVKSVVTDGSVSFNFHTAWLLSLKPTASATSLTVIHLMYRKREDNPIAVLNVEKARL